mmetsp:Transcript_15704/g.13391  ORF Transcript_15704/g.13391 Transcript_15704/m.13391 type:complete len:106 (+) Transcript_15704:879-1196(+)|eukprot:CAMPEP_0114577870 /NCGR_PEP_ID=MMETSP0125-20121206/2473_1 /TAXON_ID=485358 ORGANISM="Aristerostoma sp., Strain ATCC 50986" /NCGR_SAMPLE_ID=MMETSP0125 /ASSEMBLY_ACC=CAM_ASM_000245 /LENGTH=105 /DNA_ID=CAMNT_0001767499 /DNA_START=609 /DNA_END=926 /DNA_ORIENTATION=-
MGDTYEKVQDKKILTDNNERIDLMQESISMIKFLSKIFRFNRNKGKAFLHYVREVKEGEDGAEDWEGRINLLKRLIISKHQETKKDFIALRKEMEEIIQRNLKKF